MRNTFRRTEPSAPLAVRWGDIDTIILFSREFETKDCVCLSLEGEGEVLGEINEEMTGWNDVVHRPAGPVQGRDATQSVAGRGPPSAEATAGHGHL